MLTILFLFPGPIVSNSSVFGQGPGLIALSNLQCSGTELMLGSCSSQNAPQSCTHTQDIGLRCQQRTGKTFYFMYHILYTRCKLMLLYFADFSPESRIGICAYRGLLKALPQGKSSYSIFLVQ